MDNHGIKYQKGYTLKMIKKYLEIQKHVNNTFHAI